MGSMQANFGPAASTVAMTENPFESGVMEKYSCWSQYIENYTNKYLVFELSVDSGGYGPPSHAFTNTSSWRRSPTRSISRRRLTVSSRL